VRCNANIEHSTPSSFPRRARSVSAPNRAAPQHQQQHPQRRPAVGVRQASIGIRRMPSSNALRQVAQQPNPSEQRLNTPLPALDEEHALGQIPSNSSKPSSTKEAPLSRLRKVKSAVQTRIPFWGNKDAPPTPDANGTPGQQHGDDSMDYTSDMVDVLDTLGMCCNVTERPLQANTLRSRGCYPHLPHQCPELALHS
jgi:hypothetical protein